jgi:hypothetical protein
MSSLFGAHRARLLVSAGRRVAVGVAALGVVAASLGGAPAATADTSAASLRHAVGAYSQAFLGGRPVKAYQLLSPRCRQRVSPSYFTGIVNAANDIYGPLPIRTYKATVSGTKARVTYTYVVSPLNQTREPWVRVGGAWKNDEC